MQVEFEFYGTLRDAVGEKTLVREFESETTAAEAIQRIADEYEALEPLVLRSNGDLRPNVTVSVDGDPILDVEESVALSPSDSVVLAPGVSGGAVGEAVR